MSHLRAMFWRDIYELFVSENQNSLEILWARTSYHEVTETFRKSELAIYGVLFFNEIVHSRPFRRDIWTNDFLLGSNSWVA